MVYPGDVEVDVQVNGSTICSDVTDTSCTVNLPREVYNISITQSNDIDSIVNSSIFDSKHHHKLINHMWLQKSYFSPTVAQVLIVEKISDLSVMVTLNKYCQEIDCPITVSFGTRPVTGVCAVQQCVTKDLSPGGNATFSVETASVSRESDEEYCFKVSRCGGPGEFLNSITNLDQLFLFSAEEGDSGSGLLPGPVAVIILFLLNAIENSM